MGMDRIDVLDVVQPNMDCIFRSKTHDMRMELGYHTWTEYGTITGTPLTHGAYTMDLYKDEKLQFVVRIPDESDACDMLNACAMTFILDEYLDIDYWYKHFEPFIQKRR